MEGEPTGWSAPSASPRMTDTLTHALLYARRGWHVFPLQAGTKFPATPHGHLDATTDEATIRAWFSGYQDLNLGISLEPSGLVVLDVDTNDGKRGAASLRAIDAELTDTLTARTARGGLHAVYARPEGIPARRQCGTLPDLPDLDLIGKGYIVACPSRTADGDYVWLDASAPIAPLPPLLVRLTLTSARGKPDASTAVHDRPPASARILRAARDRLDHHGPAIQGRGGNAHTRAAWGILTHGFALSEAEALPLLLAWNLTCQPPWPVDELTKGPARSGQSWNGVYGADRDRLEACDTFGDAVASLSGRTHATEAGESPDDGSPPPSSGLDSLDAFCASVPDVEASPWEQALAAARVEVARILGSSAIGGPPAPIFMSGLELLRANFPPTSWLVRSLVTTGGTLVVGGEPKTFKTWLLTELAVACTSGVPMCGEYAVTGAPLTVAAFYAEDGGPSVRSRFIALCRSRNLDPEVALARFYPQPRGRMLDLMRDEDLALIVASCAMIPGGVDVVTLDPLRNLHSGEEDKSDTMGPLFARIAAIGSVLSARQGRPVTMAVAHHMKKATDGKRGRGGQSMRGSSAIHGAIDCGIYLTDLRGDCETEFTNTVESEIKAARGAGVFSLTLKVEDGEDGTAVRAAWTVARGEEAKKTLDPRAEERAAEIVATVTKAAAQGVFLTKTELQGEIIGNRQVVLLQIKAMIYAGTLTVTRRHPIGGHLLKAEVVILPPENRDARE